MKDSPLTGAIHLQQGEKISHVFWVRFCFPDPVYFLFTVFRSIEQKERWAIFGHSVLFQGGRSLQKIKIVFSIEREGGCVFLLLSDPPASTIWGFSFSSSSSFCKKKS